MKVLVTRCSSVSEIALTPGNKGIIMFHFADCGMNMREITERKKGLGGNKKKLRTGLCEGSRG